MLVLASLNRCCSAAVVVAVVCALVFCFVLAVLRRLQVSKGLKWVQSWRAEGQTGNGEQGQAMSPRGRTSAGRRSSIFGSPVRAASEQRTGAGNMPR